MITEKLMALIDFLDKKGLSKEAEHLLYIVKKAEEGSKPKIEWGYGYSSDEELADPVSSRGDKKTDKPPAKKINVKSGQTSACRLSGVGPNGYKAISQTKDLTKMDSVTFNKIKGFLKADKSIDEKINESNISYHLAYSFCHDLLQSISYAHSAWKEIPPYVKGSQNKPCALVFSYKDGKVSYNKSSTLSFPVNNHKGFDWNQYSAKEMTKTLQRYIDGNIRSKFGGENFPFHFEITIGHGSYFD